MPARSRVVPAGSAIAPDCDQMIADAEAMTGPARRLADDPNLAPHLAVRLLRAPGVTITTTLDAHVQAMAINRATPPAAGARRPARARWRGGGGRQCDR